MQKRVENRATLQQLLEHPFLQHHGTAQTDVASFVCDILNNSTVEDELGENHRGGRGGGLAPGAGGGVGPHNGR